VPGGIRDRILKQEEASIVRQNIGTFFQRQRIHTQQQRSVRRPVSFSTPTALRRIQCATRDKRQNIGTRGGIDC
jgi:hypothetical protein